MVGTMTCRPAGSSKVNRLATTVSATTVRGPLRSRPPALPALPVMIYTIYQLLFVSLIVGISSAVIAWMINRSRSLQRLRIQRGEVDTYLAWRALEQENAVNAATEALRSSDEQRRELEQHLHRLRDEINQAVGQYDETIANLHRNLRIHQDKLRDAQRRAEAGDEAILGERRAREIAELRLTEANSKIEAFEAELIELKSALRSSDHGTVMILRAQLQELSAAKIEAEAHFREAAATGDEGTPVAQELTAANERLVAANSQLERLRSELMSLRLAFRSETDLLATSLHDTEKELAFAEARIDAIAVEHAQAHAQIIAELEHKISASEQELRDARVQIEERDQRLERSEKQQTLEPTAPSPDTSDTNETSDFDQQQQQLEAGRIHVAELQAAAVATEAEMLGAHTIYRQQHASMEKALTKALSDLEAECARSSELAGQVAAAENLAKNLAKTPSSDPATHSHELAALVAERHELECRVTTMEEALKEAVRIAALAPVTSAEDLAQTKRQLEEAALAIATRDQELAQLREQAVRADLRIQAVTLLSEQEFDPDSPDDLKVIAGVGPVLEGKLREAGVTSYRQLAVLDETALGEPSDPLAPLRNRIRREHWIVQAKKLHLAKHGEQL